MRDPVADQEEASSWDAIPATRDPTPDREEAHSWDRLIGLQLRSVQLYEGGLGPDGPLQAHQLLKLKTDGTFEWMCSDVMERGTYRREGQRLIARSREREITAELDLQRGVPTWSGVEFELP